MFAFITLWIGLSSSAMADGACCVPSSAAYSCSEISVGECERLEGSYTEDSSCDDIWDECEGIGSDEITDDTDDGSDTDGSGNQMAC